MRYSIILLLLLFVACGESKKESAMEAERDEITEQIAKGNDSKVLNKWLDSRNQLNSELALIEKDNQLILKTEFSDGTSMKQEVKRIDKDGQTQLQYVEDFHGEYFVIQENGNLAMYGKDGKFGVARQIE